jgi:hypothetical protein
MQKVDLVVGGGTSQADSGPASSLRLPKSITALTTAPDGTVWLAAQSDSADEKQLVSVTPSGQAHRIRLPAGSPEVDSLAVDRNGVVWAASTQTVIWRLQDTALRAAYGTPWRGSGHFPGPFVADGKPLSGAHLGVISSLAADPRGGLVFVETQDSCERIRRLDPDGTVTTLVGVACPHQRTAAEIQRSIFPDSTIRAAKLAIDTAGSLALGPDGRIYVYTFRSVLVVDLGSGGVTRVLGRPADNSIEARPKIDNGKAPFATSQPATKEVVLQASGSDAAGLGSGNIAVGSDGAAAVVTEQESGDLSRAFTWAVGDSKIKISPSAKPAVSVQLVRKAVVTTASAVRGVLAFRGNTLLEGVSRDGGALVVAVPAR